VRNVSHDNTHTTVVVVAHRLVISGPNDTYPTLVVVALTLVVDCMP